MTRFNCGHKRTPENTTGSSCRECRRLRARTYYAKTGAKPGPKPKQIELGSAGMKMTPCALAQHWRTNAQQKIPTD